MTATVIAPLPAAPPKAPTLDPNNPCNAALIYGEKDISFARKQEIITVIHVCGTRPQLSLWYAATHNASSGC